MTKIILLSFFFLVVLLSCNTQENLDSSFQFLENEEEVELWEDSSLLFCYQKKQKSLNGKYARNNYIHPLMSLDGDTLTEDFPSDHPHHRGVFFAWHQIYIDTQKVSDSWSLNNFTSDIINLDTKIVKNIAELNTQLLWKSPLFKNGEPYIEENTQISVYPLTNNIRKIDFKVSLIALTSGVRIGGADNEKGYGGFSLRIKMPDGLVFTSDSGEVAPQNLQINAGPSMDFSAPFGKNEELSGITLLCHKDSPNYPQPWILRKKNSMQNIVFPGRNTIPISMSDTLSLKYTLIIHRGLTDNNNTSKI